MSLIILREIIGAYSRIPVRKWKGRYTRDIIDRRCSTGLIEINIIRGIPSKQPSQFSKEDSKESLKARNCYSQVREIKIILHNIIKAVQNEIVGVVIKEFYRADF